MIRTRGAAPALLPLAVLVAAMAAPVLTLLATVSPFQAARALGDPSLRAAAAVSLEASAMAVAVATLLGVPAGYALARASAFLRGPCVFILALPLAFPPVASGVMLLSLLGLRAPLGAWLAAHGFLVADSLLGVACAQFFVAGSFVAIAATAAFGAVDPEYADAARTLGLPEWRIFLRVALPLAGGNIVAAVAFAWLRAIGEYGATSIVAYNPTSLPIALSIALGASGVNAALSVCYGFVVLAALVLTIQWLLRRRFI